ncbi:MAG: type II/IV secretion system ATPase subunit [Candidatus Woesearchaeota archaeon]|jgi:flagellar protein FlaI|nr:type II/IV secretion system ATPase subunit [Candidatus Woesearchaeota archaeon]
METKFNHFQVKKLIYKSVKSKKYMFNSKKEFEVVKHGVESILKINYFEKNNFPSIEDEAIVMRDTVKKLSQIPSITKIIFIHNKNYEYEFNQVVLLKEIAQLYTMLSKQKELFSAGQILTKNDECVKLFFNRYTFLQNTIIKDLPADPIGAYVKFKRELRDYKFDKNYHQNDCYEVDNKFENAINFIISKLESLTIIKASKEKLAGHKVGSREIYKKFFSANIKPNFVFTTLLRRIPIEAKELDSYKLSNAQISIFELDNEATNLYHVTPIEFTLSEEKYNILNLAKEVISEHKPESNDFIEPAKLREVFFNISRDLIEEIAEFKNIKLKQKDMEDLANILIRYTVGFGLIETLLEDDKIQDISVNSPSNKTPIFITHAEFEDCKTNIIHEEDEVEGWASRLRMISGKPLDASNPILDAEIETPKARARVSVIGKPLNPYGIGFSFRRHRDKPWTLPLFIKKKMITPEAAGLLSFIIDGARTILVAGTRGSGKSSFLTAIMIEIMRKYRIITVEDTLELPTLQFADLGFNIQPMSVRSALSVSKEGFSADMGIRSTLRLGDSCLIVGEVRSTEALALYEAMRVGALANVVAGTIHGDSPYGVYDRLVNDLGVPKTSFKATDIVIVANPVKSSDGLHRNRRITRITEVRKNWENDPLLENGFQDLFKYNSITDQLEITDDLINGESDILKAIGSSVKQWAGNWDAIWDNIQLRGKIKKLQVDYSIKYNNDDILEAKSIIDSNDKFHKISEKVNNEFGHLDSKKIFFEFEEWFKSYIQQYLNKD